MTSSITTSVIPGFTIKDGWMRGFCLEETASLTGRAIASVRIEYALLNAEMNTHFAALPHYPARPN